jgi:hypothetical protein
LQHASARSEQYCKPLEGTALLGHRIDPTTQRGPSAVDGSDRETTAEERPARRDQSRRYGRVQARGSSGWLWRRARCAEMWSGSAACSQIGRFKKQATRLR